MVFVNGLKFLVLFLCLRFDVFILLNGIGVLVNFMLLIDIIVKLSCCISWKIVLMWVVYMYVVRLYLVLLVVLIVLLSVLNVLMVEIGVKFFLLIMCMLGVVFVIMVGL